MVKIRDLGEKIYLICYGRPRYKLEISNKIYGYESKAIYPEIKKLEKMGWIKQVDYEPDFDTDPNPKSGKRAKRRQYYYADIKPLFDSICQDLDESSKKWNDPTVKLNKDEKKQLITLLNLKIFRGSTSEGIKLMNLKTSNVFSEIKTGISFLCIYLTWIFRYCESFDIKDKKEKKKLIELTKKPSKDSTLGILSKWYMIPKKTIEEEIGLTPIIDVFLSTLDESTIMKLSALNRFTSIYSLNYFNLIADFVYRSKYGYADYIENNK